MISNTSRFVDSAKVCIFLGNKDSISVIPYKTFGRSTYHYLYEVKPAGNLNGKGKKDFIVSTDSKVFIYTNDAPVVFDALKFGGTGWVSAGAGGDINNDGYDDFMVGNTNYLNSDSIMVGAIEGFWGGDTININTPAFKMEGDKKWFEYGQSIDIPGDINGDGYADVFIMQPSYPDYNNRTGKLFIYSYSKITDVKTSENTTAPSSFELYQNYPNPFNGSTIISFNAPGAGNAVLNVYNILGQIVKTYNVNTLADANRIIWNGTDDKGRSVCSGVYFAQLKMQTKELNCSKLIKMIYLK